MRSTWFSIAFGLTIVLAGCSDWAASPVDSTTAPSSPDESSLAESAPNLGEPYCIEIRGSDYRWHVRYPDNGGCVDEEGRESIERDVHVPAQTDVVLVLKSDDYVYTLALPTFGLKEIAVPNLEFRMAFRPPDAGRFPLLGDQLCGDLHPELQGDLVVEPPDHFRKWLKER